MSEEHLAKLAEIQKKMGKQFSTDNVAHEKVRELVGDLSVTEAAALVTTSSQWRPEVFKALPEEVRVTVVDTLSLHVLKNLLDRLNNKDVVWVLEQTVGTTRTKLLRMIDQSRVGELENMLVDDLKQQLAAHANYPNRSIGRIMQPVAPVINHSATVGEARKLAADYELRIGAVHNLYVVTADDQYLGSISVTSLLTQLASRQVKEIVRIDLPTLSPHSTQSHVATLFQEYDLLDVPVLLEGKVVGIVLVEDILDVLQQQYLQSLQQLGGGGVTDETIDTRPLPAAKRRLPWMVGNIFLGLVAVTAIMPFEETIGQVTALAVLMPIVSDMGGNVGIQSLTVSIRSLMDNTKITWKMLSWELRREFIIGVVNGLALGVVIGLIGTLGWGNPWLGLVVAVALTVNTVVASVMGGVLPIILKKHRLDPALMSGAVLTTITDFTGFLLFLGLATVLLPKLL
jgi:magnesium transporter